MMKRTTEKIEKMTGHKLSYDGINHVEKLSDYAKTVKEYVDRLHGCDVFVKSSTFEKHLNDNPEDIKIISFSNMEEYLICYALLYK